MSADPRVVARQVLGEFRDFAQYIAEHGLPERENGRQKLSAADPPLGRQKEKLPFRTAADLDSEAAIEVDWIVPGYLAGGAVTEIDGKPKASGKTTWILRLCAAALNGDIFLGRQVRRVGAIVYLTEERPQSFQQALSRAGLLGCDRLHYLYHHDTKGRPWAAVVTEAVEYARQVRAEILIVDTIGKYAGLRGDRENNSGDALEAYAPLQAAAAEGLAVMVGRHERKSGGDVGDSGRGSNQFTGEVDIVLALQRPQNSTTPELRNLKALSRFDETPDELVIELTDEGYIAHGTSSDVARIKAREAIPKAAPQSEGDALELKELLKAAGVKRTVGQEIVKELWTAGNLCRVGEGKRGDPFKYFLPPLDGGQRQKETEGR